MLQNAICALWLLGIALFIVIPLQIRKREAKQAALPAATDVRPATPETEETTRTSGGTWARLGTRVREMPTQERLALCVPLSAIVVIALSAVPSVPVAVVAGLYIAVPGIGALPRVLWAIARFVSPAAMVAYSLAGTALPTALLAWVAFILFREPDAQAAIAVFFTWLYAYGLAGFGLAIGWLVERVLLGAAGRR
jgi:hypothetical protein